MDHYRLQYLPAGYKATTLKVLPLPGEKGAEHPWLASSCFEALSPDTENASDARNAVHARVLGDGGGRLSGTVVQGQPQGGRCWRV
jgi:hypothetical protein